MHVFEYILTISITTEHSIQYNIDYISTVHNIDYIYLFYISTVHNIDYIYLFYISTVHNIDIYLTVLLFYGTQ